MALELDDDDDQLTPEDIAAIELGRAQIARGETVSMEEVLADFGLTMAEFEAMGHEPDDEPTKGTFPIEAEALNDETIAAIARSRASLARGEGIPHEEILKEFGMLS